MAILMPKSVSQAVAAMQDDPRCTVLAGGTDLMVAVNYGHVRPASVLSLRGIDELRGWHRQDDRLTLGAGLRFSDMLEPTFEKLVPAMAQAARTVGSSQIRSTATLGGNIATASPAGDSLPVLYALEATVNLVGRQGERSLPISQFISGPKRTVRQPDELIVSVTVDCGCGPQEFLKIGNRNAMVISLASLALVVDTSRHVVSCAIGSVGPTVIRCTDAERFASDRIDWDRRHVDAGIITEFAKLCAGAAKPIDDHRSTAEYRKHAIGVLAERALKRVL